MTRTDIIMAVRGELPANLKRTAENIRDTIGEDDSLKIIVDGEQEFPAGIEEYAKLYRPWGVSRGPGQARHWGIMRSKARFVVLVDGHMTFPDGWLDDICLHLSQPIHARDITCCHMRSLQKDFNPIEDLNLYSGAYLALKSYEEGNQYWALSAKWQDEKAYGVIPAVMGACYGMRRRWYDKIGQPLKLLEAWGGDEELLSLCSWLCGGRVYLLPLIIGHVYAAPYQRKVNQSVEHAGVWANRYAIINALPMPEDDRKDLLRWLDKTPYSKDRIAELLTKREKQTVALKKHLRKNAKHTWAWLKKKKIVMPVIRGEQVARTKADQLRQLPKPPANDKPQIIIRASTVCDMCDARNSFVQICGLRPHPMFGQAYARCKRCGHKAHIRKMK